MKRLVIIVVHGFFVALLRLIRVLWNFTMIFKIWTQLVFIIKILFFYGTRLILCFAHLVILRKYRQTTWFAHRKIFYFCIRLYLPYRILCYRHKEIMIRQSPISDSMRQTIFIYFVCRTSIPLAGQHMMIMLHMIIVFRGTNLTQIWIMTVVSKIMYVAMKLSARWWNLKHVVVF